MLHRHYTYTGTESTATALSSSLDSDVISACLAIFSHGLLPSSSFSSSLDSSQGDCSLSAVSTYAGHAGCIQVNDEL